MTPHPVTRRRFIRASAGLALTSVAAAEPKVFRLWAIGDAHVGTDLRRKRESLADAIRHSEQDFEWDIALNVGDFSGSKTPPEDEEGREVVRQCAAAKKHRREDFYDLAGNHDASGAEEETQWWFRKWIDPTGESTRFSGVDAARRRYSVTGTWERYEFRAGNLHFLIMCDRNDGGPPIGRGKEGGYPAGAVTGETFAWWKQRVDANRDSIMISAHHHMLRETTVASGDFEGRGYHGHSDDGGSREGDSYLYYVDGKPKALAFEHHLEAHPGALDLWIGGHTHTHPNDAFGGRTHVERKWGANFLNCCALTRHHAAKHSWPMSRLLTFTDGSPEVRVQCYLHTADHAPQGWYPKAERTIRFGKPFRAA